MRCKGKRKVLRIYNIDKSRWGEPFVRCEAHAKKQKVPDNCFMQEIQIVCEIEEPNMPGVRRIQRQT